MLRSPYIDSAQRDANDAVVTGVRVATTVRVVRQYPQRPIGSEGHVSKASVCVDKVLVGRCEIGQRHNPEPLATKIGDVDRAVVDGDSAGAGIIR